MTIIESEFVPYIYYRTIEDNKIHLMYFCGESTPEKAHQVIDNMVDTIKSVVDVTVTGVFEKEVMVEV